MALQFTRDVKVLMAKGSDIWEIPVLDGFSFSQAVNSSEITVNEAGITSRRARLLFNDALAPVEWSMSTYVRPEIVATGTLCRAIEEPLWAAMLGADTFVTATGVFSNGSISPDVAISDPSTTTNAFNLNGSNISSMANGWTLYFAFEPTGGTAQVYKLNDVVVNSATIDFDIDGIATIQWSGFARTITDEANTVPTVTETELDVLATDNFIRNRISTMDLTRSDASPVAVYNVVLTGGSIAIENNITYLTPEELGRVNQPIANITGTRSISGNVTCYLDTGATKSGALFTDLVGDVTTVRNSFDMAINVGGVGAPSLTFDLPTAHLEIPVVNVEDLLTLDVAFHGQVNAGNVDNTDEATIIYKGA